jgi:hypothetical protein
LVLSEVETIQINGSKKMAETTNIKPSSRTVRNTLRAERCLRFAGALT